MHVSGRSGVTDEPESFLEVYAATLTADSEGTVKERADLLIAVSSAKTAWIQEILSLAGRLSREGIEALHRGKAEAHNHRLIVIGLVSRRAV